LHSKDYLILHHRRQSYNPFFIFSVTYKKISGKTTKWVIFPEDVKHFLSKYLTL